VETVLAELRRDGMNGYDISDDELAKSHARYMIGGASDAPNERIFRFGGCAFQIPLHSPLLVSAPPPRFHFPFALPLQAKLTPGIFNFILYNNIPITPRRRHSTEFPERPGALRKFLSSLRNMGWNISLFHYRNQGAGTLRPLS
jgi:hypothetical protein